MFKIVLSGLKDFVQQRKNLEKKNNFLLERKRQYPTCHFSDSCKFKKSQLGQNIVFHENVQVSYSTIGRHTYIASDSMVSHASIGRYCSIGQNVSIGLYRHPSKKFVSSYPAFYSAGNLGCCESFVVKEKFNEYPLPSIIGNDVWICNNSILIGGIRVGDGAIIAAGSVVTKEVPPYAIVGGNPARLIRYRFCSEEISFLLATSWWNWPDEIVKKYANYFSDMERFRAISERVVKDFL
ncbi:hypothetical protein GKODMF_10765 [Candidatus Electrothrix gigas]